MTNWAVLQIRAEKPRHCPHKLFWVCIVILSNLAACVEQRAPQASSTINLGTVPVVAVRAAPFQTRPNFEEPLHGTGAGVAKGAEYGATAGGECFSGFPSGGSGAGALVIAIPICIAAMTVVAVSGSLYGAAASHSETEVIAATTTLKDVLKSTKPATEIKRVLIAHLEANYADDVVIRKFTDDPETLNFEDLAREGIDILIDLQVSNFDLGVFGKIDPDASVFLELRGTLIKTDEQTGVFPSTWKYRSARRKYFELAAEGGKKLKETIQQSYNEIARQMARDMIPGQH